MSSIAVIGWHLENRIGSHNKFYTVLIADNGVVVTAWGKIGTVGQNKVQRFPQYADAEALGKRQLYSKQTGGYTVKANEFKFAIDENLINEACKNDTAAPMTRAFHAALAEPQFGGDRDVVLKHYDDFVDKAQRLMGGASDRAFDEVWSEFEELEKAWDAISNKHAEADVTISLTRQMLSQRLMSGSL